jgi:MFS family permease
VAHDRLRFVIAFLAGVLAARAVGRKLTAAIVASAVLIPLALYVFSKGLGRTLTWWSIAGIAALSLFWIATALAPKRAAVFACVLTIAELFVFTFDYNAMTDRRFFAPRLPILEALRHAAPDEPYRVLGLDWVLLPNAAEQYRLEDIRGSDPMEWAEYARFFRRLEVPDASIDVKRVVNAGEPLLDFLNVRFLLTEPGTEAPLPKWSRLYSGPDGELYENSTVQARFFGPAGVSVSTHEDRPGRYTVRISSPRRVVISSSVPAMSGWRVRVNGKVSRTERVNDIFVGFFAGPGVSTALVDYRPRTWGWSLVLFGIGILGLGGLIPRTKVVE